MGLPSGGHTDLGTQPLSRDLPTGSQSKTKQKPGPSTCSSDSPIDHKPGPAETDFNGISYLKVLSFVFNKKIPKKYMLIISREVAVGGGNIPGRGKSRYRVRLCLTCLVL